MSNATATTPALSPDDQAAAAAAAMLAALPPLDRMSLISIWIETLLYGESSFLKPWPQEEAHFARVPGIKWVSFAGFPIRHN